MFKNNNSHITQPTPIVPTIVAPVINVSCFGGNNGAINLSVSGGTPNYDYNWSGNAPDVEDPTGLTAGTYTVTVIDANGCTATISQIITQPAGILTATISASTNASCSGTPTGSATVTAAGGTTAYTYLWSNGQNTATATGLAAGSYVVTVTDMNGCTALATVNIVNPALLQGNIVSTTNVSCNGLANGSTTAGATGGTAPYSYEFRNAGNTVIQAASASPTILNLAPGTYSVVVTDMNGCTSQVPFVITQPTLVVASITATTPASCNGGTNGTATANASGGTPGYMFAWPGGFNGPIRTGLAAGSYVITATDANGCQSTATAVITQPVAPILITTDLITNVLCIGNATGAIQISVSGGTPNYNYNWSSPAPDVEDPNGLSAGTYNLTVTDNNGCTNTTSVVISQPATAVSATISNIVNAQCTGTGTGEATVNPAGGTPGYAFAWSNGQTSQTATGLAAGSYVVTVTDANGCTTLATAVITNPANLNIAPVTVNNVDCSGELTGGATVLATGGTPMYIYEWVNMTFGPVLSGVGPGNYGVTVTDNNGCEAVTSVTITEPTPVIANIQSTTPVSCNGVDDGTATASASGGVGPYTYEWPDGIFMQTLTGLAPGMYTVTVRDNNNCSTTATATIPAAPTVLSVAVTSQTNVLCFGGNNGLVNITVIGGTPNYNYNWSGSTPDVEDPSGLSAGTYTVTITDANGCTASTSVTITQPMLAITATTTGTNPLCNGASNGTATVSPVGGVTPYTYLWSNGQTIATSTGMTAGSYVVTVTDANLCQTVTTIVLVNPPLVTAAISNSTPIVCFNGNTGAATITAGGGTPAYTYIWQNSANATISTSPTASGLTAGTYRVTVTDLNGCTASTSITFTQPTVIVANIVSTTNVSCFGGNNGTATAGASGGTAPYSFTWPGMVSGALRTGLTAGSYIVTVTDMNGCIGTATAVITEPLSLPSISGSSVVNVACFGNASGSIDITPMGGTPPYSYDWSAPAQDVQDPNNLSAGTYTVVITDANGCTYQQTFTIIQPTTPVSATTTKLTDAPCGTTSGSAMANPAGGSSPYTYLWSNGQNTQIATGLIGGSYIVTVTDANGCTAIASVNILSPGGPTALITDQTPVTCFGGNDGTATVTPAGGTAPYTYNWSGGTAGTTTRTGLASSTYFVTITDSAMPMGCAVVASVTIAQPTDLTETVVQALPTSCVGAQNGIGTVDADGGIAPYTYTWPGGLNGATQTGLAAGTYTVTVTDANGCTEIVNVAIGSNGTLNLNVIPNFGPVCPSVTIPITTLASQPADPNTVYSWVGGAGAGLINGTSTGLNPNIPAFIASGAEGTYTVTVTANLLGCSASRTFEITIQDISAPIFECPSQMVMVGNDPDLCSAKVNWTTPTASDDCGTVSVTQSGGSVSGSVFPVGLHTITYIADDGRGNTSECSFQVLVLDTQFPTIACPVPFEIAADAACAFTQAATAFDAVANDNCDVNTLAHDYAAAPSASTLTGAIFPTGSTTVIWTATDPTGKTATCAISVIVTDQAAPEVTPGTCPPNITVSNGDDLCGAVVTYDLPLFEDNCDGLTLTGTLESGLGSSEIFPIGTTTVSYAYTDAAGNGPAVCSFTVTVEDIQFPQITCPANLTVETDGTLIGSNTNPFTLLGTGPCGVTVAYTAPVGTDNCTGTETDLMSGFGSGANYYAYNGTYTHIWRATDLSGNTTTCQFTINIEDPIAPIITCPANTTIATDKDECTAVVTYSLPVLGDNCSGFTITQLAGPASGAEFALGTTTVTYEIADDMGNVTSCSFDVMVMDMQKPAIDTCPANMIVLSSDGLPIGDCLGEIPNLIDSLSAFDNCTPFADLTIVQDTLAGQLFGGIHGATQIVQFTVTDLAGNFSTCTTIVTLEDDELPTIDCAPATRAVDANANCQYQALATEFNPVAMDNCTVSFTHNYAPAPNTNTLAGAIFPLENTILTFTAADAKGNTATCTVMVTVEDNIAPIFVNCPSDITVGNDVDQCGRNVVFPNPIGTDNCGTTVALTSASTTASGNLFPVGTTTVVFEASDAADNLATCSFTITVEDRQMPKAICAGFTINLDAMGVATITPANINGGSSDNCTTSANLTLIANQTSFDCSNEGLNYVVLTVTDQAGNVNNCVSTVTVNDVTPPVITCPPTITVSNCLSTIPDLVALTTATDVCGISNVTQNTAAGLLFLQSHGNSQVIVLTATDVNGNTSTCSVNVTVNDNIAPTIICPANITMSATSGTCDASVTYPLAIAMDNCSGVVVTNVTPAFPSGGIFPLGITPVTFQATDNAGNTVQCIFTVTVTDNQAATITCPTNIDVNMSVGGSGDCMGLVPNLTAGVTAMDNCTVIPLNAVIQTPAAGTIFGGSPNYVQAVTFTVTDAAGNVSSCVMLLNLIDTEPPMINCDPAIRTVNTDQNQCYHIAQGTEFSPIYSDNCSVTLNNDLLGSPSPWIENAILPIGNTIVIFTVTDGVGLTPALLLYK